MQSTSVNRREVYCSVAFTGLVVALGAVYAHSQSKFSPASQGSASWGAVTELSVGALVLGNLIAMVIAGIGFGIARLRHRRSTSLFGIYVMVVNVVVATTLWIVPSIV